MKRFTQEACNLVIVNMSISLTCSKTQQMFNLNTRNFCFSGKCVVVVGSHSGRLIALDLDTAKVIWNTQLPDRIESSLTPSLCGTLGLIGLYYPLNHTYNYLTIILGMCAILCSPTVIRGS